MPPVHRMVFGMGKSCCNMESLLSEMIQRQTQVFSCALYHIYEGKKSAAQPILLTEISQFTKNSQKFADFVGHLLDRMLYSYNIFVSLETLKRVIDERMKWYEHQDADIIVVSKGKLFCVLRYRK